MLTSSFVYLCRYLNPTNLLGFPDCGLRSLLYDPTDTSKAFASVVRVNPGLIGFEFGLAFAPSASFLVSNQVKMGDMLVAVDVGMLPWTPETDWGKTRFKTNICGPKAWDAENNVGVACTGVSSGDMNITSQGIYDIYYVKYNGKSEFGVDKGYGKDFMKLNQQVCTYENVSKCETSNIAALGSLNQIAQSKLIQQIATASDNAFATMKAAIQKQAVAKLAAVAANNTMRIVPVNFVVVGFGSEYVGKDEKTAIEDGKTRHLLSIRFLS